MNRLWVVHHAPSPATQAVLEAVLDGARDPELAEVEVVTRAALGGDDTTGAVRSVERIATGLSWRPVAAPVTVTGTPGRAELAALRELGATVAATLLPD